MTLIAAAGIDTYPVVCGDLFISGPSRPDSAPNISLAGAVTSVFPPGSDWSCHVVLVHSPKDITVFNRIDYSESRTPRSISFFLQDRHISFVVSQQFADELTQSVHAGFAEL